MPHEIDLIFIYKYDDVKNTKFFKNLLWFFGSLKHLIALWNDLYYFIYKKY